MCLENKNVLGLKSIMLCTNLKENKDDYELSYSDILGIDSWHQPFRARSSTYIIDWEKYKLQILCKYCTNQNIQIKIQNKNQCAL